MRLNNIILTEAPSLGARQFVIDFYAMGSNHFVPGATAFGMISDDGKKEGVVTVKLVPQEDDVVILDTIASDVRGEGFGTYIMQKLVNLADKRGITLKLDAVSFNKKSTVTQLHSFYRKFNFVPDDGSVGGTFYDLVRYPR